MSSSTPAPGSGSKAAETAIKEALKGAAGQELKVKALTVKVFAACKGSIVKADFKEAFDALIAMGRVVLEGKAGIPQKQVWAMAAPPPPRPWPPHRQLRRTLTTHPTTRWWPSCRKRPRR